MFVCFVFVSFKSTPRSCCGEGVPFAAATAGDHRSAGRIDERNRQSGGEGGRRSPTPK